MSGGSELHAGEIGCLVLRLVIGVRLLGVFAGDKLPDLTREIRPLCFIINTDPKDLPGTHRLAQYAPIAVGIKLFDSFGLFSRIYSLDFLHSLHLSFVLSPSSFVYGHYCIVYISSFS